MDRGRLNDLLVDAAEKMSDLQIYFEHRLVTIDFDQGQLEFDVGLVNTL